MGLQSQLNDVSTDSIPLLLIALIATSISYSRSLIFTFLNFLGFTRFNDSDTDETTFSDGPNSGSVAGWSVLAEQLNVNRCLSHRFGEREDDDTTGTGTGTAMAISDCIVCLSKLRKGEIVRRLDCKHVFHKQCLDGWFGHRNFNCPLCRSPLVLERRRVDHVDRRVYTDLLI